MPDAWFQVIVIVLLTQILFQVWALGAPQRAAERAADRQFKAQLRADLEARMSPEEKARHQARENRLRIATAIGGLVIMAPVSFGVIWAFLVGVVYFGRAVHGFTTVIHSYLG
jgi:hypothetical protein